MNNNNSMLTSFIREDTLLTDEKISEKAHAEFMTMAAIALVLAVMDGVAVYFYGVRALIVTLLCVSVCWVADTVCIILRRKMLHIHDISPIVTGLAIAAMLPASVPYEAAAAACLFAICVAKQPFGGHGCEIINVAAAGYIFAELSFPKGMLLFPKPFTVLPASAEITEPLVRSFSSGVALSGTEGYSDFELLIGSFPGPMGCTFSVLTIVCILFLISRKAVSTGVFLTEIAVIVTGSMVFSGIDSVKAVLAGGMTLFAAGILTADCNYAPSKPAARLLYGVLAGILTVAITRISSLENPAVYACIISAPFAAVFDRIGHRRHRRRRVRRIFGKENEVNETIEMIGGSDGASE